MARLIPHSLTPLAAACAGSLLLAFAACGSQHDDDVVTPGVNPTATAAAGDDPSGSATPTAQPTAASGTAFWMGARSSPFLVRYDASGKRAQFVDLKKLMPDGGGVSALVKLDSGTLMAFLTPTTGTQKLVTVNSATGEVKDDEWFMDASNLSSVTVNSLHAVGGDSIFATKYATESSGVERILHTSSSIFRVPRSDPDTGTATPWIGASTTTACVTGVIRASAIVEADGKSKLLMLSSGSGSTLLSLFKDIATAPSCESAYDYGASGLPTSSTDVPVAAVSIGSNVYVLYSGSAPKIVSYDFNGSALSNATLVLSDAAILGTAPRAMIAYSSTSVLVANNTTGALFQVKVKGDNLGWTGFSVNEFFTSDVGALVVEK